MIHHSAGSKSQRLSVSDRNFISELFQTDVPRVIEALRIDDQYGQRSPAADPDGRHRPVPHGVQPIRKFPAPVPVRNQILVQREKSVLLQLYFFSDVVAVGGFAAVALLDPSNPAIV